VRDLSASRRPSEKRADAYLSSRCLPGVLSGHNPAEFNPTNPITLFIIQLSLILVFTNVLALGFARVRQPKVIAEVIAGIILGPTVLGRVPGFSSRSVLPSAPLCDATEQGRVS